MIIRILGFVLYAALFELLNYDLSRHPYAAYSVDPTAGVFPEDPFVGLLTNLRNI